MFFLVLRLFCTLCRQFVDVVVAVIIIININCILITSFYWSIIRFGTTYHTLAGYCECCNGNNAME